MAGRTCGGGPVRKGIALALLVLFTAVLGTTGTVGCAGRLTRWRGRPSEAQGEHREDKRRPGTPAPGVNTGLGAVGR